MILIFVDKQQGAEYLRALETMQEGLARILVQAAPETAFCLSDRAFMVDYITAVSSLVKVLAEAKVQVLNG